MPYGGVTCKMASKGATLKVFKEEKKVSEELGRFVVELANEAISRRNVFTIGLSAAAADVSSLEVFFPVSRKGAYCGSAVKYLSEHLPKLETDWTKWRIFFCDERHVPYDDPECTFTTYRTNLFSHISVPDDCIFPDNPSVSVEDAAREYTEKLKSVFGCEGDYPQFDLLLLGMGPDGHTCSLFPGHPLLDEKVLWVASITDSPKPPPQRITLTLPVLLNTRCALFVACGQGKAGMVQRVLQGNEEPPLPAARVKPHNGNLVWFLDEKAASLLENVESKAENS